MSPRFSAFVYASRIFSTFEAFSLLISYYYSFYYFLHFYFIHLSHIPPPPGHISFFLLISDGSQAFYFLLVYNTIKPNRGSRIFRYTIKKKSNLFSNVSDILWKIVCYSTLLRPLAIHSYSHGFFEHRLDI